MNRKVISAAVAVAMTATMGSFALPANAAEVKTPQYQTNARQMEKLNRGLIAVKTTADTRGQAVNGVYLSWRLLGDESLENQAFDIYKNGTKYIQQVYMTLQTGLIHRVLHRINTRL